MAGDTNDIIPQGFLTILRCPACGDGAFSEGSLNLVCDACGHEYPEVNGLVDLRGTMSLRMPRIYADPSYRAWCAGVADAQDYFYRQGRLVSFVQNAGHRAVRRLRGAKEYACTLDLGCGDGAHIPYLREPARAFGIDIDQPSLEKLRSRHPSFFVVRADVYDIPVRDESVDCIINIYNLEHMAYLDLVLEEMYRVLTSNGDTFISVPTEGGLAFVTGRSLTTARAFTSDGLDYNRAMEIDHINSAWQLEKAIKRYFKVLRKVRFPGIVPGFHLNLVTTYHCVKREAR